MKYAVVYVSPTGNTEMLAETIRRELGMENCVYFGGPQEDVPEADMIFAGFWTDKGTCSTEMSAYLKKLENQKVFLFGTAGFGGAAEYFDQILERVKANLPESSCLEGTYMCQGRMPATVRKRYESMLAQNPDDERMKSMIENFDKALAHPDTEDTEKLVHILKSL